MRILSQIIIFINTPPPHPLRRAIDAGTLIEFEAELR